MKALVSTIIVAIIIAIGPTIDFFVGGNDWTIFCFGVGGFTCFLLVLRYFPKLHIRFGNEDGDPSWGRFSRPLPDEEFRKHLPY